MVFSNNRYVLTLSPVRDIIFFTHFFTVVLPQTPISRQLINFCEYSYFITLIRQFIHLFLFSCRFLLNGGKRFFCSPYTFCVFSPISLLLVLKWFTVAILNKMCIVSVKNGSSDSNSPGGDVVNPRRRFFRKSANRKNIFNLFFVNLGKKRSPFHMLTNIK